MSARPRILNAEPDRYSESARALLAEVADVEVGPVTRGELLERVGSFDALIVRLAHRVDLEVLEAGTRLRAVASATTGLDHIDVEAAARGGVRVLSLRGETEFLRSVRATTEHTFALLLGLLRNLDAAAAHVREGGWDRDAFRGRELSGRRLGIVGLGRIGSAVAALATAYGMHVHAFDPYREDWEADVERMPSLSALLSMSDIVSLHVPLSEETRGMIGAKELALLPKGAVLVNTARGSVVDESALVTALRAGQVGGVAADVVQGEGEAQGPTSPLLAFLRESDRKNVLVTPHIGGATRESMERTEIFMARKLAAFLTSVDEAATP